MDSRLLLLSIAALAVPFVAQQAAAQSTLSANMQADRAVIQQDQILAQNAVSQLRTDEAARNVSATAADRTALRLARMQVGQDFDNLRQDARLTLQADRSAVMVALTQLHSDQVANNSAAAQADQASVAAAQRQLGSDREAIFGGLGAGLGHMGRHRRG